MNINATLLGQMITFALFVWFTMKFVWPPIMKAMAEREKTISDGLAAAERGKKELTLAQQKATETLREAKGDASKIIEDAKHRSNGMIDDAKTQAREEGQKLLDRAKGDIDQEANRARTTLRREVASIAVAGAEKILGRQIDAQAHSALVDDLIAELEEQH